ncbi:MAG: tetrahydromethanopterin S-methyltransferase subunit B [Methanotrichaceae archaeon]
MGIVRVTPPEMHLIFDAFEGVISEEREDVIQFALDPIIAQIDDLDKVADDLMNSLSPDAPLLNSYKNRDSASFMAGIYTNIWYGFIIGLVVSLVLLLSQGGAF